MNNRGITEIIDATSFSIGDGANDCDTQYPPFWTNITSYYDWIQNTIDLELAKQRNAVFIDDQTNTILV